LSGGFFFRRNGAGYDLRRNLAAESGGRKQSYIAYLSESKWKEITRTNRKDSELRKALSEWLSDQIRGEF
jgi:hypothetical protein